MGCLIVITITLFLISVLELFLKCLTINYKIKGTVMSYRDVNSAQQAIRRNLNSVNLEPENKAALEAVAISMAAAGKPGEFVTYMQALEKTETAVDLKTVAENVSELVNTLKAQSKPEPTVKNTEMSDIGHAITLIGSRLDALEGK